MRKPKLRLIIFFVIGGIFIAFLIFFTNNSEKYRELLSLNPKTIILLVLAILISIAVNGTINIELFRGLGIAMNFGEGFVLSASATFANQLPISGGLITRAYYLKQKYDLSYTKFFSINLALFVCFISINGFVGIFILFYWLLFLRITISVYLLIGFGLMSGFLVVFLLPLEKINLPDKIKKWLVQAIDGWYFVRKNPKLLVRLILLQTLMMLILAVQYYLVYTMMSQQVSAGKVVLFAAASVLTQLVSIAPGGLGILETIVSGLASILDIDIGVSLVALGINRVVSTLVVFFVGGASSILLARQMSGLYLENDPQDQERS